MADEITSEPVHQTPTEPQPASDVAEAMPDKPQPEPVLVQQENPISESNPPSVSPQEPTAEAPIPPIESTPAETLPEATQTSPNPEDALRVKDDISANEPLDLTEEIKTKQREENLKLANETRQEKKREKIDKILDLFAKQTNLTNDEVEKLLHVSDATATRYLEQLEKENKIRQVGKTGKSVTYEKI